MHGELPTGKYKQILYDVQGASVDAMLLIDQVSNRFVECNAATVRMLGAPDKKSVLNAHPWELSPEVQPDGRRSDEKSAEMNALAERNHFHRFEWTHLRYGNHFHRFEWTHLRYDGTPFPVEVTLTPIRFEGTVFLQVIWRDLSEIRRIEAAERRYFRARELLATGNRTLTRVTDEQVLLNEMCRIAVDVGGYRLAWVGYRQEDQARSVKPVAKAGMENHYLDNIRVSWGDEASGRGPVGRAVREGSTQVVQDFLNNPITQPWRDEAAQRGYRSCIAMPLRRDGETFGSINIYSDHPDAFDEEEVRILETMAEDLAFGIVSLRREAARKAAEHELDKALSLLRAAVESAPDGILVSMLDGRVGGYNRRFAEMFNIPEGVAENRQIAAAVAAHMRDPESFSQMAQETLRNPRLERDDLLELKDGRMVRRIVRPQVLDGEVVGVVSTLRDVTDHYRHERELRYHATHDALTGLPNRMLFADRLEHAIGRAARGDERLGLIFIDLDRFKLVNDSIGHEAGDRYLKAMAERMRSVLRAEDTLARQSGDEFLVLLENMAHDEDAASVARNLCRAIAEPLHLDKRELHPAASLGISLYPRDGRDAETLIRHADTAMYRAKELGGNGYQFFLPELQRNAKRKLDLIGKLRRALQRDELQVHYQLQRELVGGELCGAEALLRWKNPKMGDVSPLEFIPLAEETGLIHELGDFVLRRVCADIAAWRAQGLDPDRISINLSARQFEDDNLKDRLIALLKETGIPSGLLELEITEGALVRDAERAAATLRALRKNGFHIAIDDFGTGYSSLAYLKRFSVDRLKIDRSFIAQLPDDSANAAIVRAVIAMAHELDLQVVAEGVETEEQLQYLIHHRCDAVQGYYLGYPMAAEEFGNVLRDEQARSGQEENS